MSLICQTDPIPTSQKRHGLYLGSKGDAKSRSKLEAWGVTHILNMTPEKEAGIKVNNYNLEFFLFPFLAFPISDVTSSSSFLLYFLMIVCFSLLMIEKLVYLHYFALFPRIHINSKIWS